MELPEAQHFSATMTQLKFTETLQPIPASTALRDWRQHPLATEESRTRQRFRGPTRRLLAGINDVLETAKEWQSATALKYQSGLYLGTHTPAG